MQFPGVPAACINVNAGLPCTRPHEHPLLQPVHVGTDVTAAEPKSAGKEKGSGCQLRERDREMWGRTGLKYEGRGSGETRQQKKSLSNQAIETRKDLPESSVAVIVALKVSRLGLTGLLTG